MNEYLGRRQFFAASIATAAAVSVPAFGAPKRPSLGRKDFRSLTPGLGLDHPEGITTGPDGRLYAGGVQGQVYRIEVDGHFAEIARTGGVSLGLSVDGDGFIYVCDPIKRAVLRITPAGEVTTWCDRAGDGGLVLPNDCAFAPDGSLWVTDAGHEDPEHASGRLLRIPPQGGPAEIQATGPLHFPNGICVDGEGTVFFVESFRRRLMSYAKGRLALIAATPGFSPDGVTLDRAGGFVITSYYPFALLTLRRGARQCHTLFNDEWGITLKMPANSSYFGAGLRDLAISNLGGFAISAVTPPVPGAPLNYPKGLYASAGGVSS